MKFATLTILITLFTASQLSFAADKSLCRINFENLNEVTSVSREIKLNVQSAFTKKGYELIEDSELQKGDLVVQKLFNKESENGFYSRFEDNGSVTPVSLGFIGFYSHKKSTHCIASASSILTKITDDSLNRKDISLIEIKSQIKDEDSGICWSQPESFKDRLIQQALLDYSVKLSKCGSRK